MKFTASQEDNFIALGYQYRAHSELGEVDKMILRANDLVECYKCNQSSILAIAPYIKY